jgi:RHS repeat-associated protein
MDGGTLNLTNSTVAFSGGGANSANYNQYGAIYATNGAAVTINGSTIRDNYNGGTYAGVKVIDGSLDVASSSFIANRYGIYVQNLTYSQISSNNIKNNSAFGIYNYPQGTPLNAENNWWGSTTGPAPYGSGNGINYASHFDDSCQCTIIDQFYVDAAPWLGQANSFGQLIDWQAYEVDPVNTATGNYAYRYTDVSIATRSYPLEFTRSYNSSALQDGPLGFGWTHSYNIFITESNIDGTVAVRHGDGREDRFSWNGSSYDPPAGTFSSLEKVGGLFHMTLKDQTVYSFDALGRLSSILDINGEITSLSYDAQGRLSVVTEPAGRTLAFDYASPISAALISRVTDTAGRSISFTYDAAGNMTEVEDVRGYATTYAYDAEHRLQTITDANGHTFVTNAYDNNGRVVEQQDADGNSTTFLYDIPNHRTIVTDALGHTTKYQYDSDLRLISETDALGNTASYTYDDDNNRTQVVDRRGNTTNNTYDGRGNILSITDTLGFTRSFTYDGHNNLLSVTDADGNITSYTYDPNDNITSITDALGNTASFSYDSLGQMTSATDALGNTSQYSYDSYGYQTLITDALGYASYSANDIIGRLISETDAEGRTTSYTYDDTNHLLSITNPLGNVKSSTYDAVGNRLSIVDPSGNVTRFVYDAKDRLINKIDPLGNTIINTYNAINNLTAVTNPLNYTTTYTYDAINRRISVTDALGNTTEYIYDANGNRTSVIDANGNITSYAYDARDQLVRITDPEGGFVTYSYDANGNRTITTDANGHTTTYTYDALNRLTNITDPLGYVITYNYDAVGNLISQTKADGTVINFTYDSLNRRLETSYPNGSITYNYDAVGNRTSMTDTSGVTTYNYDDMNQLTMVDTPNGLLNYNYDASGNRISITYPDGKIITYSYDAVDRLASVTDWASRESRYSYDAAGRQVGIQFGNGTQATYTYDDADRLINIMHTSPVSGTIGVFTYTLDAVGNRLSVEDLNGLTNYTYDPLYRLTQVTYPHGETVSYSYDSMGNRLSMNSSQSGITNYTYDVGDRLLSAGPLNFAWDANGNMIGKGSATFTYDALDRLTTAISGTTTVQFEYDGDGTRLSKTVNGIPTDYVQDLAASMAMILTEETAGETDLFVHGNDILCVEGSGGAVSYYHTDGLGSVRALSDASAGVQDEYYYDAFGKPSLHYGSITQPFAFAGEQLDSELDLIYMRARYYDPELGRFISKDPIKPIILLPYSLNRYQYAANNPVLLVDPTGGQALASSLLLGVGPNILKAYEYVVWYYDWKELEPFVDTGLSVNKAYAATFNSGPLTGESLAQLESLQMVRQQNAQQAMPLIAEFAKDAPYSPGDPLIGMAEAKNEIIGTIGDYSLFAIDKFEDAFDWAREQLRIGQPTSVLGAEAYRTLEVPGEETSGQLMGLPPSGPKREPPR